MLFGPGPSRRDAAYCLHHGYRRDEVQHKGQMQQPENKRLKRGGVDETSGIAEFSGIEKARATTQR
jgi:hypothetical protein